jgi:thioredoxin reductase (NADPH)
VLDSFGTQHLQKLVIGDKKDLSHTKTLDVDALFLFIGATPLTEFLGYMDVADENGFIKTDNKMQTSVKGLFACGDARLSPLNRL